MSNKKKFICLSVAAIGIMVMLMANQTFAWLLRQNSGGDNTFMTDPFTGSVTIVIGDKGYLYVPGDDLAEDVNAALEVLVNYRIANGGICNMRLRAETKAVIDDVNVIRPCIDVSQRLSADTDAMIALGFAAPFTAGVIEDDITYWYYGSSNHALAAAQVVGTGAQVSAYNILSNAFIIGNNVDLSTGDIEIAIYLQIKQYDSQFPWTDVASVIYRIAG